MFKHLLGKAVVATVVCCFFLLWWYEPWQYFRPAQSPAEQVKQTSDYCAQLAGYDDGSTDDERFAIAVATINLAKKLHTSTCDVYENFSTLIGPGSTTFLPWFRKQPVMYGASRITEAGKAKFNQTGLLLKKYLTDPAEDLKRFPWLACVDHYIRSTWTGYTPWPDKTLRTTMKLVYTSASGAEFFCPP